MTIYHVSIYMKGMIDQSCQRNYRFNHVSLIIVRTRQDEYLIFLIMKTFYIHIFYNFLIVLIKFWEHNIETFNKVLLKNIFKMLALRIIIHFKCIVDKHNYNTKILKFFFTCNNFCTTLLSITRVTCILVQYLVSFEIYFVRSNGSNHIIHWQPEISNILCTVLILKLRLRSS